MRTEKNKTKFNKTLFRAKVALKDLSMTDVSKATKVSQSQLSHKIRTGVFQPDEMVAIQNLLELSVRDFNYLFFEGGLSFKENE